MRLIAIAAALLLALGSVGAASAGPASGSTTILGRSSDAPDSYDHKAHANTPTDVDASIVGGAPIVPYEYSIVNQCWFGGKSSGPADSFERYDLAGPWIVGPDGAPHTTVAVNNNPVPGGATCRVTLYHANTAVKGSTTSYPIVP